VTNSHVRSCRVMLGRGIAPNRSTESLHLRVPPFGIFPGYHSRLRGASRGRRPPGSPRPARSPVVGLDWRVGL
jgi:hypothetical protein